VSYLHLHELGSIGKGLVSGPKGRTRLGFATCPSGARRGKGVPGYGDAATAAESNVGYVGDSLTQETSEDRLSEPRRKELVTEEERREKKRW